MGVRSWIRRTELLGRISYARELVFGADDPRTIPYLEWSVERFPKEPEFHMLMAIALMVNRGDEEIAAEAARAAELAPASPAMQVRAGNVLINHGGLEAARDCVARARERVDEDFPLITGLVYLEGRLASNDGEYELAEEKFRWTVATEPERAGNAIGLARFLWARGRIAEAVETLDEAEWAVTEGHQSLADLRAQIVGETAAGD
jgi:tetratricopeptide (TPR) repeat protein